MQRNHKLSLREIALPNGAPSQWNYVSERIERLSITRSILPGTLAYHIVLPSRILHKVARPNLQGPRYFSNDNLLDL